MSQWYIKGIKDSLPSLLCRYFLLVLEISSVLPCYLKAWIVVLIQFSHLWQQISPITYWMHLEAKRFQESCWPSSPDLFYELIRGLKMRPVQSQTVENKSRHCTNISWKVIKEEELTSSGWERGCTVWGKFSERVVASWLSEAQKTWWPQARPSAMKYLQHKHVRIQ